MGVALPVLLPIPEDIGLDPPVFPQVNDQLLQEPLVVLEEFLGGEDVAVGEVLGDPLIL